MEPQDNLQQFLKLLIKVGYRTGPEAVENLTVYGQKSFDFYPDFVMFSASYLVNRTFVCPIRAPRLIDKSLCFYFENVILNDDSGHSERIVRVFPCTHIYNRVFKEDTRALVVAIMVQTDYLKTYLGAAADQFRFLFDNPSDFVIEEVMTDAIVSTLNAIAIQKTPDSLPAYYYRLKTMELLFHLCQSLTRRKETIHRKLSEQDIESIYRVRDQLISCLSKPCSISELKQIAGMNELKMRTLFKQVFGRGIYEYYQYIRMQEAARLLRDPSQSVFDVGTQLGYENLSHFSRVFEKHLGSKPKKFSAS